MACGSTGVGPGAVVVRGRRPALWAWGLALGLCLATPLSAQAGSGKDGEWVQHRVLFGERLSEIAERHGVSVAGIIRWNKLDKRRPRLRAGRSLRIYSRLAPPERQKITHLVKRGESWAKIARHYGVSKRHLRRHWNRKKRRLRAGDHLIVWVEQEPTAPEAGPAPEPSDLPVVPVPTTSFSVGAADRGRLVGGLPLPDNPSLYTVRNKHHSYGSSHTLMQLQLAIARWRQRSNFAGPLVINDMSTKRGGRFRPHRSHRSGRDVDIRLPAAPHVAADRPPVNVEDVDWDATWKLLESLLETDQVRYIFLSRSRQRALRAAALRAGVTEARLAELIEYPRHGGPVPIRHARGHTKHFHVRFKCAEWEERCRE